MVEGEVRGSASLKATFREATHTLSRVAPWCFFFMIGFSLLRAVLPGLQIFLVSKLVSSVAISEPVNNVLLAGVQLGVVILLGYVFENAIKYLGDVITLRLSYTCDKEVVKKLAGLEVQQLETEHTYDLVQRVGAETGSHIFGLFDSARTAVQSSLSLVSIAAVIWFWSAPVAILLMVAPVPAAVAMFRLQSKTYEVEFERAPDERVAGYYREMLTTDGVRKEIRLFDLSGLFRDRYLDLREKFRKQDVNLVVYGVKAVGTLGLVSVIANIGAVLYGAITSLRSGNVGELAGYINASTAIGPLVLSGFIGLAGIYQHLLYASNWKAVLDLPDAPVRSGDLEISSDPPVVEFDDVSFVYPGTDREILRDVTCRFEAGRTTALVGVNGAGKSTLVKLLLRFYEPTSGNIYINGIDIAEYSRAALYGAFSALFQDFVQYERMLGENVSYGDLAFIDDEPRIWNALETVGLAEVGRSFPNGLATVLGRRFEGGQQLSVGQWQRVAMARALYKEPSLLVLDEPTASVDAISEKAIFDAIVGLRRPMTTVLVAHRFATISNADRIVVMRDGHVLDTGTHTELLERCQFYREMFETQVKSLKGFGG